MTVSTGSGLLLPEYFLINLLRHRFAVFVRVSSLTNGAELKMLKDQV